MNPSHVAYAQRHGKSVEEFHEQNLDNGFIFFPVELWKASANGLSAEGMAQTQVKIKELDDLANPVRSTPNGPRPSAGNHKPFFRYISVEKDGSMKCNGGGFYLYSGWSVSDDPLAMHTRVNELRGKVPLYFRAKSAVRGSKLPNFSVQWNKVVAFYFKPPEGGKSDDCPVDFHIQKDGKVIRIPR